MSDAKITFISPEGLEVDYKLLSYFKLRNGEENYIIFRKDESFNLCYGRLLGEDNEQRVIKVSGSEDTKIKGIIEEPKAIKFVRLDEHEIEEIYIVNYNSIEVNENNYNVLLESDLFKEKKYGSLKLNSIMRKKQELTTELSELKRKQIAAKWREVKNESRTITDDSLLELVENELNKLEQEDFVDECSTRYKRAMTYNVVTLIISFVIFFIAKLSGDVLKFIGSAFPTEILDLIKMYGRYALILLIIQCITYVFFKKYRLLGRIFTLFGLVFYIFRSLQILLKNPITFGWLIVVIIILINSIIGVHTYLKLRTKHRMII